MAGGSKGYSEAWGMDAPRESQPRVPSTILVAIAVWVLAQTLLYVRSWPADLPSDFGFLLAQIFSFVHAYLIVALVGNGLLQGWRFAWIVAFIWQGLQAGFGFINLSFGTWDWDLFPGRPDAFSTGGSGFYGGPFPVIVALVSAALLLAPQTRRWLREP